MVTTIAHPQHEAWLSHYLFNFFWVQKIPTDETCWIKKSSNTGPGCPIIWGEGAKFFIMNPFSVRRPLFLLLHSCACAPIKRIPGKNLNWLSQYYMGRRCNKCWRRLRQDTTVRPELLFSPLTSQRARDAAVCTPGERLNLPRGGMGM